MIDKDFLHIDKRDTFESLKKDIKHNSLTFINETRSLYYRGREYLNSRWVNIDTMKDLEYVDMDNAGYWAICNVGANSPEDPGLYFEWGITTGYYPGDHAFSDDSSKDEYKTNTTLLIKDDAARAYMGGFFQIPNINDYQELFNTCNVEWITNYKDTGVAGVQFTSLKNNNSIFIPTNGYITNIKVASGDSIVRIWTDTSASNSIKNAVTFNCTKSNIAKLDQYNAPRGNGHCIRAFIPKDHSRIKF